MPRPRRPPGAGTAFTYAFLFITALVAAQQQQPLDNDVEHHSSPRIEARVDKAHFLAPHHAHHPPNHDAKPSLKDTVGDAEKRRPYTPLLSQNVRAVATKVPSAPAISAVRAHPARHAASGGLIPSARSLQDWEVEDFVLLATVDGHIHARDRYNGEGIWELTGKPMLETIYNVSNDQPYVWIVEPREDGALYLLQGGPNPTLQHLGVTVKQLAEAAPFTSDDPDVPVVYNVEKKTFMLLVDAASGLIKQSFTPGGIVSNDNSCAPESKNFFTSRERDCRGVIDIGQTEYTITIHNKKTNEHICTLKYAEWNPNSRDKDLQSQYDQTLDKQYIYTSYSGEVVAYDYKRPRSHQRPLYKHMLPCPVARVFDVARPLNDESAEPPLVLLPQPTGPIFMEDRVNNVLLNTTNTGAWYALSEANYPAITHGAPTAACLQQTDVVYDWDTTYTLPDPSTWAGVHKLDHRYPVQQTQLLGIPAPTYYDNTNDHVISNPPTTSPREQYQPASIDPPPPVHNDAQSFSKYLPVLLIVSVISLLAAKPKTAKSFSSYLTAHFNKAKQPLPPVSTTAEPEPEPVTEKVLPAPEAEVVEVEQPVVETVEEVKVDVPLPEEIKEKEKKVTFDVPEDEEEDVTPLSRTTTIEQSSPVEDEAGNVEPTLNGEAQPMTNSTEDISQDPNAPSTPKKKKTHRGRRGGRKLSKNQQKEEDEVNRIVDAAKQLEVGPRLQPDELTMNPGDMQDISNIKRIGKLTIDQDRLLGNGSGGTFVFEGKWKVCHNLHTLLGPINMFAGTQGRYQAHVATILWARRAGGQAFTEQ
jgi:serine/threonine-protein kinase/endoribonuclease IRE1